MQLAKGARFFFDKGRSNKFKYIVLKCKDCELVVRPVIAGEGGAN